MLSFTPNTGSQQKRSKGREGGGGGKPTGDEEKCQKGKTKQAKTTLMTESERSLTEAHEPTGGHKTQNRRILLPPTGLLKKGQDASCFYSCLLCFTSPRTDRGSTPFVERQRLNQPEAEQRRPFLQQNMKQFIWHEQKNGHYRMNTNKNKNRKKERRGASRKINKIAHHETTPFSYDANYEQRAP